MLKAVGTLPTGRKIFLIGLSWANLDRLRADQPIKFDGAQVYGLDGDVIILAGESEQAMAHAIASSIGPNTITLIDPALLDPRLR